MEGELETLLRRVALGDRRALELMFDRTAPGLHALCLRVLGDRSEAEAALADGYAKIWRYAERFAAARADAATFVTAIVRNLASERLRERLAPSDALRLAERAAARAGRAERRTLARAVPTFAAALDALGARDAALVRLAYFGGVSYAALADRDRTTTDAARARWRGVLAALAARLGSAAADEARWRAAGDDVAAFEYVLALEAGPERRRFEVALLDDPALAAEVWHAEAALRPLADALSPVRPRARVFEAVEDRLFGREARAVRAARRAVYAWRSAAGLAAFATMATAAALAVVLDGPERGRDDDEVLVAAVVRTDGAIVLLRLQPGRRLVAEPFPVDGPGDPQLWLLRDGAPPTALGALAEMRRADLPLPADLAVGAGARLMVTLEPSGPPGDMPSGPQLGFGSVVRL